MKFKQSGFTLIELVVVIVILGILAAIISPKYIDITDQAYDSVADGGAGALGATALLVFANGSPPTATDFGSILSQMEVSSGVWFADAGSTTDCSTGIVSACTPGDSTGSCSITCLNPVGNTFTSIRSCANIARTGSVVNISTSFCSG